jgi:hypothetical protein
LRTTTSPSRCYLPFSAQLLVHGVGVQMRRTCFFPGSNHSNLFAPGSGCRSLGYLLRQPLLEVMFPPFKGKAEVAFVQLGIFLPTLFLGPSTSYGIPIDPCNRLGTLSLTLLLALGRRGGGICISFHLSPILPRNCPESVTHSLKITGDFSGERFLQMGSYHKISLTERYYETIFVLVLVHLACLLQDWHFPRLVSLQLRT